ncbi:MAG: [protein-PII] uridylyltransferase [Rhizobiales bacterium]|nr:[protein-PII] uridylyltransferase [Hyphomicrobiales bacterium]
MKKAPAKINSASKNKYKKRNTKKITLLNLKEFKSKIEAIVAEGNVEGGDSKADSIETRGELIKLFKATLQERRQEAERLLLEDGDGRECARRISKLQDTLIRSIYDFATTHVYPHGDVTDEELVSVVSVGGYGRGLLAPGSDIDLLFILPQGETKWCEQIVEYILYFLWDLGQKVGHATRNVDECLKQAKGDMTIRTAVLERRLIVGSQHLFDDFSERFDNDIVRKTAKEFIDAKLEERDGRHKKTGSSRYLVEPNVKDGKGGLRDLHTLYWIGKYYYQVKEYRDLVEVGLLNEDEYARFQKASDFLWTVRCHMHFLVGKAEERLSFDIQRQMAERLKYFSHNGLLNVERFMKHYFLVAKEVGDLTLAVCSQLEEDRAKSVTGINGLIRSITFKRKKISGTKDFVNDHGRINVVNEDVFKKDPVNLLRLFKLADDNDLDIHPDANTLITRSLKLINKDLRANKDANKLFMDVVSSRTHPEILLRKMNETGVLGRFIPSFGKIVAMMQFNMYHHYTVDEHLIRSVGVLARIENGKIADEHPLAAKILPSIKERKIIYLTLLIHDIAKGRKEDHSIAGARIAKNLCPRLGFTKEQTELVSWLVQEHLTMSQIAQSRDLSDRQTISDFATTVQSLERMRYLLLLTVCDIRAVGPGVWNGWKGQLIRTLYYETEPLLTGGFSKLDQHARLAKARTRIENKLSDWDPAERERVLALPYDTYYLSTSLEDQVQHMAFIKESDAAGETLATQIKTLKFEAITEITVLSPDHPALLSVIAAACAAAGANIVDAKIHTTSDGRALDSIYINRIFDDENDEIRRAERVSESIRGALAGKVQLEEILKQKRSPKASAKAFRITPSIEIDNDLSEHYSVIEIACLDKPGVLSTITRTIASLNLNIGSAHIATFGEKVIDNFYVTDLLGLKITSTSRRRKIIQTLTEALKSVSSK